MKLVNLLPALALTLLASSAFAQISGVPAVESAPGSSPGGLPVSPGAAAMMQRANQQITVHLNSASLEQIEKVPGLNADLAQAIIAGRPYASVTDLKKVKGITTPLFNKIKGFVSL